MRKKLGYNKRGCLFGGLAKLVGDLGVFATAIVFNCSL